MEVAAILNLIAGLVPVANTLITTLQTIREQTEVQHPEVWAKVRDHFKATDAQWAALMSKK